MHTEEGHRQLSASSMINPLSPDWRGEERKIRRRNTTPPQSTASKYLSGWVGSSWITLDLLGKEIMEVGFE